MRPEAGREKLLHSRVKARQLALLVALHDRRSLRQAAAEIAISQPAATKMLHELEDAFGARLFERHAWGMKPTLYGETLVRYARGMLTDIREARDEIAALASGAEGRLRVGAETGAVPQLVAPALRALHERAPAVQMFLLVNASEVLAEALREGTLEVGIGPPLASTETVGLDVQTLTRESLCIVTRHGHPLGRRRRVAFGDLDGLPWILQPRGTAVRDALEKLFVRHGIRVGPGMIETVSIVGTLALLQTTDALSVLPVDLARHYEQHGMLARLAMRVPAATDYVLLTRADRPLSPVAAEFMRVIRRIAARR